MSLRGGDFHLGFIVYAKCLVFILVLPKNCNGKTKGLGTLPVYVSKSHVLFHYWRRRDPPVLLRRPENNWFGEVLFVSGYVDQKEKCNIKQI